VTGETIDSTFTSLSTLDLPRLFGEANSLRELVSRLETFALPETEADPRGMAGNSARCALELALLDAYSRREGRSVGDAVRMVASAHNLLHAEARPVRYSGAITAETTRKEITSALKMRLYGFTR